MTDLCAAAPVCADFQADVWSLSLTGRALSALAVGADGDVLLRVNDVAFDTDGEPLAAAAPGRLVSLSSAGVGWQSSPGDAQGDREAGVTGFSDARMVATAAGLYVVESFGSATIGGVTFPAEGSGDTMLSLVSYAGETLWSRLLGFDETVQRIFADEQANVIVKVSNPDAPIEFAGRVEERPITPGHRGTSKRSEQDRGSVRERNVHTANQPRYGVAGFRSSLAQAGFEPLTFDKLLHKGVCLEPES